MLKIRVIPTLLLKNFGLVKGVSFDSWRRVGPALPAIKVYNQREVDELIFLDVSATTQLSEPDYELVKDLGADCFVPFTVGGGISELSQVQRLLAAGADKVSINSASYERPKLIEEIASKYGSQCLVVSVDVRYVEGDWICFSHSGVKSRGHKIRDWVKQVEDLGAGEILITSIDKDGTMSGYDLPLIEAVVDSVNIPVIASGGAGSYQDIVDVVNKAGAAAAAAASIFHFTELTPSGAKDALGCAGFPVRKNFIESSNE